MAWCSAGTCCPALAPGGTTATPAPTALHPDGARCLPCTACLPPSCQKPSLCQPHHSCQGKGPQVGQESGFTPHSWVALAVALGAWGWHCTVAPAVHRNALEEVLEEGLAVTETSSCLPLCTPRQSGGCLAWVWGGAAHCRHDYRKALLPLESQEGEISALSNLPSCSRSHPALLYRPDTL